MMKKGVQLLFTVLLILNVNYLYSQFYDVKKVRRIATVHPVTENRILPVFSKTVPAEPPVMQEAEPSDSTVAAKMEKDLFSPPLDNLVVTSPYGYRTDPFSGKRKFHHGTDFETHSDNVYSMMPGRIRKIGYNKVLGNYIELDHGDFRVTYAHLHTVIGEKGDYVRPGQSVGISGSTGRSTGEHLHVAIRYKNKSVDPYPLVRYIRDWSKQILTPADTLSVPERELQQQTASLGQP